MDFSADLAAFYADFGESVTVNGTAVVAIFDSGYGEAYGVAGTVPTLRCRTSTVPAVATGQTVVRAGVSYTVRGIEPLAPDNLETRLVLERA